MNTMETSPNRLNLKEKIAYGLGDVGNNFLFDLGQIYLLKFYTDVLGIPAVWAGSIFLVTKIFDAFADITVGTIIDSYKGHGKWGKFRPFMIYGLLPLALLSVACFTNPGFNQTGNLIFAYATYILFGLSYSIVNIPFGSMASVMTQNPIERSQLAAYRQAGSNTGLLVTTMAFMPIVFLFDNESSGYFAAVTVFAIAGILITLYSALNIKEHVKVNRGIRQRVHIGKAFKSIGKNTPLLILCIVNLFTFSAFNVKLAVQVYYCQYLLNDVSIIPYMGFFSIGSVFVGVALVTKMVKLLGGRKQTYMFGCAVWAVGDVLNYIFTTGPISFIIFSCVAFFGSAFVNSLNWALVADAVEYGEYKTGIRAEGIVYSFFTFFRKCSQAVAGFVPGLVLTIVGYVPNAVQSVTALNGIRGLMFIYPSILALATIVVMGLFYKLNDKRFKELLSTLTKRKTQAAQVAVSSQQN